MGEAQGSGSVGLAYFSRNDYVFIYLFIFISGQYH